MRTQVAQKYLTGKGLEIGALHFPTQVPSGVEVIYVDRPPEEVAANHPDVVPKVKEWTIDDAESLLSFDNSSLDFIMAHHVLEHLRNPLVAIREWTDRLKIGGVILFSLPNKDHCFDRKRPTTSWAHVYTDLMNGTVDRDLEHYIDWFMNSELEGHPPYDAFLKAEHALDHEQNIHFHAWDLEAMRELVRGIVGIFPNLNFVEEQVNGGEVIYVLRKVSGAMIGSR